MNHWDNDDTRDYIGDGVYVAYDGYNILIRRDSHMNAASEICLEPGVLDALVRFSKRMKDEDLHETA